MKKEKAKKHLAYRREHLEYLRESYVRTMRDPNWKRLDHDGWSGNPFREMLDGIKKDMEETKAKIAMFERMVI